MTAPSSRVVSTISFVAGGLCTLILLYVWRALPVSSGSVAEPAAQPSPTRSPEAAEVPQPTASSPGNGEVRFEGRLGFLRFNAADCVEVAHSAGILDLNDDFTVELWARWSFENMMLYLATDEVWNGMHPGVRVPTEGGWALRYAGDHPAGLQFIAACPQQTFNNWFGLECGVLKATSWRHFAVARTGDTIGLFVDGILKNARQIPGMQFTVSPTNMYLGARRLAEPNRQFWGDIRAFRVSSVSRYDKNFNPQERLESDDDTLVLYQFRESDREVIKDLSGHGHDGHVLGPTWIALDEGPTRKPTSTGPPIVSANPKETSEPEAPPRTERVAETVEYKADPKPEDFVGRWSGRWDDRWQVRFTITWDPQTREFDVVYEWLEFEGEPLRRQERRMVLDGNVLRSGEIDIQLSAKDPERAMATGNFATKRLARLVRESAK